MVHRSRLSRRWRALRSLSFRQWLWVVEASVVVPAVQLSLTRRGFKTTVARLARRSDRVAASTFTAHRDMALSVRLVADRPIVGSVCLGRSLSLWFMLRRRGVDADLIIGADPPRDSGMLAAHAWVEVGGVPVNDAPDVRERYGSFGVSLPKLSRA
ncbi:MAG: lasso peptide biosynthesis B2 protein [Ilumatobacteraceae bacterium]